MLREKNISVRLFVVVLLFLFLSSIVSAYVDEDVTEENDLDVIKVLYVEETAQREFIVDVPYRIELGRGVPIFFEVRDAYGSSYWEYSFYAVEIYDGNNNNKLVKRFSCTDLGLLIDSDSYCTIDTRIWYSVKYLSPDLFKKDGDNSIKITAKYIGVGIPDGDAEPDNEPYPLIVYVGEDLPKINNWYCGDTHYHSSYTDTKFLSSLDGEFGGPLNATMDMLDALGLDWVTVTDHSNSFSEYRGDDIGLSWDDFKEDCNNYDKCLVGTEINCDYNLVGGGNHLLAYDYSEYIEDNFVDVLSPKNPSCGEMIDNVKGQGGFTYAAHPESIFDPFGVVVNTWEDYSLGFDGLQIWNGDIGGDDGERVIGELEAGVEKWKDILLGRNGLEARKVFVSAGSDAHGDFQEFGKEYTCCYADSYSKENIFEALMDGNCYMGNNGGVVIGVDNLHGDVVGFGGEINVLKDGDFEFDVSVSIDEFCNLSIYRGIIGGEEEVVFWEVIDDYVSEVSVKLSEIEKYGADVGLDSRGYYRFECIGYYNDRKRIYANPIWVNPIECFSDADCGESFLESSCEGDRFCDVDVNYFCRNNGTKDAYCFEDRVEGCEDCRFGCDGAGCVVGNLCDVVSPLDGDVFSERDVPLEIIGVGEMDRIEYIDNSASGSRWKWLCRNCDGYVGDRWFGEGGHDVSVRCSDFSGREEYDFNFFVDSLEPVILGVEPSRGFSNGSFSVRFREANPSVVTLYHDGIPEEIDVGDCVENRRALECGVSIDGLSDGEVEYWFVVEDVAGRSVSSEKVEVVIDTIAPIVMNFDSFWREEKKRFSSYINFYIEIEEDNFDEVVVSYDSWGRAREKLLCDELIGGVCEGRFVVRSWYSNVRIVLRDEAGNWVDFVLF